MKLHSAHLKRNQRRRAPFAAAGPFLHRGASLPARQGWVLTSAVVVCSQGLGKPPSQMGAETTAASLPHRDQACKRCIQEPFAWGSKSRVNYSQKFVILSKQCAGGGHGVTPNHTSRLECLHHAGSLGSLPPNFAFRPRHFYPEQPHAHLSGDFMNSEGLLRCT